MWVRVVEACILRTKAKGHSETTAEWLHESPPAMLLPSISEQRHEPSLTTCPLERRLRGMSRVPRCSSHSSRLSKSSRSSWSEAPPCLVRFGDQSREPVEAQRPVNRTGGGSSAPERESSFSVGGSPWRRRATASTGHSRPPTRRGVPSAPPARTSHQSRRVVFPAARQTAITSSMSPAISA